MDVTATRKGTVGRSHCSPPSFAESSICNMPPKIEEDVATQDKLQKLEWQNQLLQEQNEFLRKQASLGASPVKLSPVQKSWAKVRGVVRLAMMKPKDRSQPLRSSPTKLQSSSRDVDPNNPVAQVFHVFWVVVTVCMNTMAFLAIFLGNHLFMSGSSEASPAEPARLTHSKATSKPRLVLQHVVGCAVIALLLILKCTGEMLGVDPLDPSRTVSGTCAVLTGYYLSAEELVLVALWFSTSLHACIYFEGIEGRVSVQVWF